MPSVGRASAKRNHPQKPTQEAITCKLLAATAAFFSLSKNFPAPKDFYKIVAM